MAADVAGRPSGDVGSIADSPWTDARVVVGCDRRGDAGGGQSALIKATPSERRRSSIDYFRMHLERILGPRRGQIYQTPAVARAELTSLHSPHPAVH